MAPRVYRVRDHEQVDAAAPPASPVGRPIAFAHRGARLERRENTIPAFELALRQGATGLESDAWLTADGEVVLHHDATTGPPWHRRLLASQPLDALPPHIPTLNRLYQECGQDFELSIDVKDAGAFEGLVEEAAAWGAIAKLWLCHDDVDLLVRRRAADDRARLVHSTRRARIEPDIRAHAARLRRGGIDALNLPHREWSAEAVAAAHAEGRAAFGWGAQRAGDIRAVLGLGVDGVYSDHVARMMAEVTRTAPSRRPDTASGGEE
jgi:glycerophosphoryl diester phosphodiesterase